MTYFKSQPTDFKFPKFFEFFFWIFFSPKEEKQWNWWPWWWWGSKVQAKGTNASFSLGWRLLVAGCSVPLLLLFFFIYLKKKNNKIILLSKLSTCGSHQKVVLHFCRKFNFFCQVTSATALRHRLPLPWSRLLICISDEPDAFGVDFFFRQRNVCTTCRS